MFISLAKFLALPTLEHLTATWTHKYHLPLMVYDFNFEHTMVKIIVSENLISPFVLSVMSKVTQEIIFKMFHIKPLQS